MTEWISVKDRTPALFERVLIVERTKEGDTEIYATKFGCVEWGNVTHWMPLPNLPVES